MQFICVYVCVYVSVYVCVCVCVYACVHTRTMRAARRQAGRQHARACVCVRCMRARMFLLIFCGLLNTLSLALARVFVLRFPLTFALPFCFLLCLCLPLSLLSAGCVYAYARRAVCWCCRRCLSPYTLVQTHCFYLSHCLVLLLCKALALLL